jgi:hypothetical protein
MKDERCEEALRAELRSVIGWEADGSKVTRTSLAQEWGLSQPYLSLVLLGRRHIGDKLANAMGYDRRVVFSKREADREG